jgi:hypothetical protein
MVRYGKTKLRVFRAVRDLESKVNDEFEYNAARLVEGTIKDRCPAHPSTWADER